MSEIKTDVPTPKISGNTNNQSNDISTIKISDFNNPYEEPPKNGWSDTIETIEVDLNFDSALTIPESGTIKKENIDFSRIATTADKVTSSSFIKENKIHTEYWGDNGELTYKIQKNGVVGIYENGTLMGFTDLQGIGAASNETPTPVIKNEIESENETTPKAEEKVEEENIVSQENVVENDIPPVETQDNKTNTTENIPGTRLNYRLTSYYLGDGSSGDTTASGLKISDFQVNENGWYTYNGKLVVAAASPRLLSWEKYKNSDQRLYNLYDELTLVIDGVSYDAIILDVCGAAMREPRIDLFVQDKSSVKDTQIEVIIK